MRPRSPFYQFHNRKGDHAMSRHCIATEPFEIVVGWDPPLQTFFLQILDLTRDEEQEIVLWLGTRPGELPTVADLEAALASHATLTPELRQTLEEEKARSTKPTALQRLVIEMFNQSKLE
jgi:hypothetical protein